MTFHKNDAILVYTGKTDVRDELWRLASEC